MRSFQKGDILRGADCDREGAYHPVVYLDGPEESPLAVVLTSSDRFACNKVLAPEHIDHGVKKDGQYFIAHRIQKLSDWAPYEITGRLTIEGVHFIESALPDRVMKWEEYLSSTKHGCSDHQ